jgi:hypothetical protein
MTLKERVVRYLVEAVGAKKVKSNSGKYEAYETRSGTVYFVGQKSAVRYDFHGRVSTSISMTKRVHALMYLWESERGLPT